VAELDLNPVIASANGVLVIDLKMRLARVDGELTPIFQGCRCVDRDASRRPGKVRHVRIGLPADRLPDPTKGTGHDERR